MSVGKCQKLDAQYTNLKVFLVVMKRGIFFLKLGHDRIFVGSILIFTQRLPLNLSNIEKARKLNNFIFALISNQRFSSVYFSQANWWCSIFGLPKQSKIKRH
jgi:hypothetical protein